MTADIRTVVSVTTRLPKPTGERRASRLVFARIVAQQWRAQAAHFACLAQVFRDIGNARLAASAEDDALRYSLAAREVQQDAIALGGWA